MQILRKRASTSNILRLMLRDSSTGAGLTGLTNASSGLIISTIADVESSATAYTAGGSTIETISTLGTFAAPTATKCRFKEVDATNHPGLYELQFADARFAVSNARALRVSISGATGLLTRDLTVQLTSFDPDDAIRAGLTSLPNANAEASGGLPTLSAAQASNGTIQANVHRWLTGTPNSLQSGRVDSYIGAITAGVIAAASFASGALDAVWSTATRTLTAFGFSVTIGTNSDKTGYTLTSAYDAAKTAAPASDTSAIKVKTDQLAFDGNGYVRTDINAVNDVVITGTGVAGSDEWRPV
jgi:hypothetical protein